MRYAIACWRLVRIVWHVGCGIGTIALRFQRMPLEQRQARVQAWALALLPCMGISLAVRGQPPLRGPMLLAANHISWLDIPVMHAARYCRFVSKADVARWPVIRTLANAAGSLYIERESRRDAMRVVHGMAHSLRAGDVLAVFPEGTTGDGRALLSFHANLLQAAIVADVPVQPVALRFIDKASGAQSFAPRYVGDDWLIGSVWRTLCAPPLVAVVSFGEPQRAAGRDRRQWAQDLQAGVARLLDAQDS
ncbi:lysophospholipid acyltransferase family protein [Ramlibacter sp. H39-3-26]|uniref:lysophospholipid acyltransferase family protein n=1 Tax=Curvibacter soli TaxID=3031331 RepID=UPI0023D98C8F|nr:lysophospholipid acyltransferase family protein [Ramlibacter sp. H39-3-26]MDF1484858.1 lysophospholipid acyltransferase family protein [Ramlibacter sp. H39-3-26]